MLNQTNDEFLHALGQARLTGMPLPQSLDNVAPDGEDSGYRVQAKLAKWLISNGQGSHVGYKIGTTNKITQELLGVPGPIYGHMLSSRIYSAPASIAINPDCKPAIECELTFRMKSDVVGPASFDARSIARHIDAIYPSIEIVENRYGDFRNRALGTMIADDFFHKACVLGGPNESPNELDLANLSMRLLHDGREVETGNSRDVMGHPLAAVAWLANKLLTFGTHLKAGQLVMTGTMSPVYWLQDYPASVRLAVTGLGDCSVTVTATD